jgi:hypothetical protein
MFSMLKTTGSKQKTKTFIYLAISIGNFLNIWCQYQLWAMNSMLNSFACLTVFSFSVYIILRIVSRSFSSLFKNEEHVQRPCVRNGITQDIRRDMGFYESYLTELNTRYGTKIYAALSLKSMINLRRHDIKNTLQLLSRKHPMLRARVISCHSTHASKRQFVIDPEERLVPELRFVNTSNWKLILEEELAGNNDYARSNDELFWKTIVLRGQYDARQKLYINTFLFLFDPIIVDRISVVRFTEDFTAVLCKLVNCDICVDHTKSLHLPAPTEECLRPPFTKLLVSLFKQVVIKLQTIFRHPVLSHQKDKRCRSQAKPLIVMKCLSEEDTSRLLKYCHHFNCSLTALFITAWSDIMTGRTGSTKALCHRKPVTIVVDYRTSMRTKLPQLYLSNCSSCFQFPFSDPQNRKYFASTARECENQLKSSIRKEKHLDLIWQLKYDNLKRENVNGSSSPLEIADIGKFGFNQTWPFSLHEIFIGACSTSTVNLTLLVVNNKLHCAMHLTSHFSGCADLLSSLFARIVQNISLKN